jgi:uncharacterized membrane protein
MNKIEESRIYAFLAVFLTIIGFIIALLSKRNNEYVMYYAKQGLVLFIIQIFASGVTVIPIIGSIISVLLWIIFFITWVLAWINALSGKKRRTLIIGKLAKKIRL